MEIGHIISKSSGERKETREANIIKILKIKGWEIIKQANIYQNTHYRLSNINIRYNNT